MLPDSDDMEADAAASCTRHHEDVESSFRQSTQGSFGIGATSFIGCGPIVSYVGVVGGNSCDASGVDTVVVGASVVSFVGCGPIVSCVDVVRGNSCDVSGVNTVVVSASVVSFVCCGPVVSCVDRVDSKSYDAAGVDTAVGSAPGDDSKC